MNEEFKHIAKGAKSLKNTINWTKRGWYILAFICSNFLIFLGLILILTVALTVEQMQMAHAKDEEIGNEIPPVTGDIIFPMDNFRITCSYICYPNHGGLDLSDGYGAIIRTVMDGEVIRVVDGYSSDGGYLGHPGGFGNYVVIAHENNITTYYAHMIDSIRVEVGDEVVIGQVIGQQGNSGNSSGSHLHFEWREDGIQVDPFERLPFGDDVR